MTLLYEDECENKKYDILINIQSVSNNMGLSFLLTVPGKEAAALPNTLVLRSMNPPLQVTIGLLVPLKREKYQVVRSIVQALQAYIHTSKSVRELMK